MANPLSSYLLSLEPTFDVLSAYSSDNVTLAATAGEAWVVVGGFKTGQALLARLQVCALAAPSCSVKIALFGPTELAGSRVEVTAGSDTIATSQQLSLAGQTNYLIAASCSTTIVGDAYFGVVRTASLTAP